MWQLDQNIFRDVNLGWHQPVLDWFFFLVSSSGLGVFQIVLCILLFMPWRRLFGLSPGVQKTTFFDRLADSYHRQVPLTVPVLITYIVTGLLTTLLKRELPRERPSNLIWSLPQENIFGNSFPSGHTSTSFGIAFTILFLTRHSSKQWYGYAALVWACLVGIARIYRGVHWPSDVLGGVCLGLGCASLLMLVFPSSFYQSKRVAAEVEPDALLKPFNQ